MSGPLKITLNLLAETVYDGSTARIEATAVDFDGNTIVPGTINSTVVNIYDTTGNYAVTNAVLGWNPAGSYWYYDWQNALPGVWYVEVTFISTGATPFTSEAQGGLHILPPPVTPTNIHTTIPN